MLESGHNAALSSPETVTRDAIRRAGSRLKRRIALLCTLIVVAICALVSWVVLEQRDAALKRAERDAANLTVAFEEQARRVIDNVAGAMQLLIERIQAEGPTYNLSEWTRQVPELAASTIQVAIIGADGQLKASTVSIAHSRSDFTASESYRTQKDQRDAGLHIARPAPSPATGQMTIEVSHRLETVSGAFKGVVIFFLNPEYLTEMHKHIDLGETGSIALVGRDGVIRARYTTTQKLDAAKIGSAVPTARGVVESAHRASGSYVGRSVVDGVTRIISWRAVTGYPLLVTIGIGKMEALAAANRQARMVLCLGAVALALPMIIFMMLSREIDRRVKHEIDLFADDQKLRDANTTLTLQHAELLATSAELASERRKLEETNIALAVAKQDAEEASKAKSAFLANMSHELRTPLNAIIGFAEIIRDNLFGDNAPRYGECAADIQRSGVHLLNIINGILDVAKIEAGKFILCESVMRLSDLVAESLTAVRPQAARGAVELIVDLPANDPLLRCDETRFKQIMINLLSNAIKFTQPGGSVTIAGQSDSRGGLCLSIQDTGIGMSETDIDCAFELFRQVDNAIARRSDGTGLGLPLAVQLAELHDIKLDLESAPDIGTTVRLHIPAARLPRGDRHLPAMADAAHDDDRRAAPRDHVRRLVFIHSGDKCLQTLSVDLSATGLRIERIANLSQGERVLVDLGAQTLEGIVVWQNKDHIGLRFVGRGLKSDNTSPWHPIDNAA